MIIPPLQGKLNQEGFSKSSKSEFMKFNKEFQNTSAFFGKGFYFTPNKK
jgi:hypothetical protein